MKCEDCGSISEGIQKYMIFVEGYPVGEHYLCEVCANVDVKGTELQVANYSVDA